MSATRKRKPIATGSDWNFSVLERFDAELARLADEYRLDTYPNQIEVITTEQMMDAYASVGMPVGYHHWSFGKQFLAVEQAYKRGQMGLAYELVINSDPCIAYLMEENTLMMQVLVMAHACYGHNSFFKGNYLFRTWTDASSIVDYLVFARKYIAKCEERHGVQAVEQLLDACHALQNYGVDRYKRPSPISAEEEAKRQEERESYLQTQVNMLWRTIPESPISDSPLAAGSLHADDDPLGLHSGGHYPPEPQENLLYFIEKNAPLLAPWQREIVRIVRKLAQYFYPQRQTQVMNEGWACFWHYTLMNRLYDDGNVDEGLMLEFLQSHAAVINQPAFDHPHFSGINPYALGFAIFMDIKRICEAPTDEDREWFPDIAGTPWRETLEFAMRNFKDESFIQQFLSPKVMRDHKLFLVVDDDQVETLEVAAIHNEQGYRQVREALATQYALSVREPNIQVVEAAIRGDRSLTLHHVQDSRRPLGRSVYPVIRHLQQLWGFPVHLVSLEEGRVTRRFHWPVEDESPAS
ncbi:SpoVR family protein [Vreelandella neptunia]|jgi:stage V sporulation protein R|uniref:SpoVR family protein n=1 Tax=Vreelandella neptunia TaxID=115551 RepID=A0ABZ0YHB9_9GAMM|nr:MULTISPECIES: SpoVR family protein [Halomonas]MBF56555.1 SpoVR family protein [Halomonas sp.]MDN3561782.1 SpoVR family protein [Halomonas neptunia]TDW00401.1 spore cortex formation protein SpoVR/YcgB (stage V sporulation) [Halomonas alkaliantarctica]WQH11133.1 SpoVR family protein [Halomonas neptunia]